MHIQRARPVDTISKTGKKLAYELNTLLNLSKEKKIKIKKRINQTKPPQKNLPTVILQGR